MRLRIAALHLLVLWAFAVAQPLFDLLGKNGEFFAARGSTRWDVVLFAVVLLLVPPAILTGVEALTPRPARGAVHALLVGSLVALFVLQAIRGAGGTGWLLVAIAAVLGAAAAVTYTRFAGARLILTVLAPAPLLFLGLFLLHSDASRLTFSGTDKALAAGAHAKAPVVLVAFDELPVNSLRDSHGRIDAVRFPHFAALAAGSTWFANTSTVAEGTTHAVPAILTGRFPRANEFPVYTDHRQNLFTLLGGAADLHVVDQETHLCPPKLCPGLEGSFGGRMRGLAEDTGVVYLRQLLPGRPHRRDPFDRERLGQLPPGREQARRSRSDPAGLSAIAPARPAPCALVRALHAPAQPLAVLALRPPLLDPAGARLGRRRGLERQPGGRRPVLAAAPAPARLRRPRARKADRTSRAKTGSTTARWLSSPPTTASAFAPARSGARSRRATSRTSPTCRCS